jgi:cytidylate kinase
MNTEPRLEQCLTFINCHLRPASAAASASQAGIPWRAVTISRQTGSGAHAVAQCLAEWLPSFGKTEPHPWTVFDRNLVQKVLEDNHLPARMARFMPEDRVSQIDDVLEDMCGLHPLSSTLVEKTSATILRLAELGNVIVIGRGANVVTRHLNYVFHVKLVGSLEKRIEYVQKRYDIGKKTALEFIRTEDSGRRRYLKKYFRQDIDDPLLYHLVINTDLLGHKLAARLIEATMLSSRPAAAVEAPVERPWPTAGEPVFMATHALHSTHAGLEESQPSLSSSL